MNSDIFKKLSDEYSSISQPTNEEKVDDSTKIHNEEIFEDEFIAEEDSNNDIVIDVVNLIKHWENAEDKDKIMTEWLTGERIRKALYGIKDYETGYKILSGLADQTFQRLGPPFDLEFIQHCLKLSEAFPDMSILTETAEKLSRDQVIAVLELESDQERLYFCELCKIKKWTLDELQSYIIKGLDETQKLMEE